MAVLCDICSGELMVESGGEYALCQVCGMKHSIQRVREKINIHSTPAQSQAPQTIYNSPKPTLINSNTILKNQTFANNAIDDEIYDASFDIVNEDISYYTRQMPESQLAELEGRVGNYRLRGDTRTDVQLHQVFADFFASPIFKDYTIDQYVPASALGANPKCMDINFLFKLGGRPVLAVAILRSPARSHGMVTGTINACRKCGIKYIDFVVGMPNTRYYVMRKTIEALGLNRQI